MQARGSKAVTIALLTINGALAFMLWMQLDVAPSAASATVAPAAPRAPPPQLPDMLPSMPPISAYQELAERPLFWIERRMAQETPEVAADAAPVQMPFVLLGVVKAGNSQAVLGRTASKEVSRVRVGDVAEGWLVEAITQNSIALVANGVRRELQLGTLGAGGK